MTTSLPPVLITSGPNWLEISRGAWPLKAIDLDCNHIPDAAMTLAVMALYADGPTRLSVRFDAHAPLADALHDLIGDAWRPDESGWSDAAYKGSITLLNKRFNAKIDPMELSTIGCDNGEIVFP